MHHGLSSRSQVPVAVTRRAAKRLAPWLFAVGCAYDASMRGHGTKSRSQVAVMDDHGHRPAAKRLEPWLFVGRRADAGGGAALP